MRVAVIGSALFGFRQPFAGGMEAHTWELVTGLRSLGHRVTVWAGPGSDARLGARPLWDGRLRLSDDARRDVSMTPETQLIEHMAYQRTMVRLIRDPEIDVVHLNCVHALPVSMSGALDLPVTATLHSPPTPWLELAYGAAREDGAAPRTVAVSSTLADQWGRATGLRPAVILNGVDVDRWRPGPGDGGFAVWTGRIVPEKAPHLAIDAARLAGVPLVLAGPAHDRAYFDEFVAPRLGSGITYVGHLRQKALARLVGRASVALVTPAWEEPFGLVVAEAMACGTPVAGVMRGALPELVTPQAGALADADPQSLAEAVHRAVRCDRSAVRRYAVQRFDKRIMVQAYETLLHDAVADRAAPRGRVHPEAVPRLPAAPEQEGAA